MDICTSKHEMRKALAPLRASGASIGLVPTMGYLHAGHGALVQTAARHCNHVAASIFVNPTQFGPSEDLASYPRDPGRDLAMLRDAGVAAVFMPAPDEMYHPHAQTNVETAALSGILIGAHRPGHFRGVATVVTKLLNIVQPTHAFFGRKDYQQLAVIRTMVRDLDIPVKIIGVPTQRDADGLALSSRNVRLTADQRAAAPALNAALDWAETTLPRDPLTVEELAAALATRLAATPGADVQSVDIRDADTLAALTGPLLRPAVILLAVKFGDVLLIDQRVVTP